MEGRSFEAIRTEEFRLLGHALPVVIIAGGRGAADTRNRHYVFSSEFGLLAIFQYKEGGETHSIFLSRSAVGFGR
ncbi:hypothetical protein P873_13925 [Arenimonas composti TR7-09 = DSM 18010]|uniref:Uncharacterized protein n=1 Tax=Arenimonas composti TR7-09 = DSM 18010 TaxID=1121013 RepID=A0A091BAA2_9GAMM|nr:hypothetical protein P873_13925 [Arenimonas composti TR7-09 = DSM 18010]